jgi:hypothetical protein
LSAQAPDLPRSLRPFPFFAPRPLQGGDGGVHRHGDLGVGTEIDRLLPAAFAPAQSVPDGAAGAALNGHEPSTTQNRERRWAESGNEVWPGVVRDQHLPAPL